MNKRSIIALLFLLLLMAPAISQTTNLQPRSSHASETTAQPVGAELTDEDFNCLPETFTLDESIAYRTRSDGELQEIKLKDRLREMQASCRGGKLVDRQKREIRIFRVACFGNPPADYDEIRQREQEELSRLKKHFTVILIECNPRIQ
jgi:hypothetical protein